MGKTILISAMVYLTFSISNNAGCVGILRYVVAVLLLAGSAPNYFLIWFVWRGLSLFMPEWIYQVGDDFLYSLYQKMVVFVFEHCTGVKVHGTTFL